MSNVRVFLLGGAPGVGKTTLGCALAAKLGIASVTTDDLMTVAQTVTTPESHPSLHVMRRIPHPDYFTHSSLDQLKSDTLLQHEAMWPVVLNLIQKHALWAPSRIVIDGWHLRPNKVAELQVQHVWSGWVVASAALLEERERQNLEWMRASSDPDRMFANFLARNLWYNELIRQEAAELQMNVLCQDGKTSVDDLCRSVLAMSDG
jgi:2-phosphoglycerate kinase